MICFGWAGVPTQRLKGCKVEVICCGLLRAKSAYQPNIWLEFLLAEFSASLSAEYSAVEALVPQTYDGLGFNNEKFKVPMHRNL